MRLTKVETTKACLATTYRTITTAVLHFIRITMDIAQDSAMVAIFGRGAARRVSIGHGVECTCNRSPLSCFDAPATSGASFKVRLRALKRHGCGPSDAAGSSAS